MLCTWQLPWSTLTGPFLTLVAQMGAETTPFPCRGTISIFEEAFSDTEHSLVETLTTESLLTTGCGYGHENVSRQLWLKGPLLALTRSGNMN